MKNVMNAEIYKLLRYKLLWIVPIYYMLLGIGYGEFDHPVLNLYQGLVLFVLPSLIRFSFPFAVAVVTAYAIGGDFSQNTFQNALYIGISKREYFCARLLVQMLLTGVLFAIGVLSYMVGCCLIFPKGNVSREIEMLGGKFAVYMLVVLLQLWVYTAVFHMLCYFVKGQLWSIVLSLVIMYGEVVVFQVSESDHFDLGLGIMRFSPSIVLRNSFEMYACYDRVFTFDFLKFGISAMLIIVAVSTIGYVKFRNETGKH